MVDAASHYKNGTMIPMSVVANPSHTVVVTAMEIVFRVSMNVKKNVSTMVHFCLRVIVLMKPKHVSKILYY